MQKHYYRLTCKIKLVHNVSLNDLNEYISNMINKSMIRDSILKERHSEKNIKFYVFSNLYPFEIDKQYKKDKEYSFYINIFEQNIALRLKNCLEQEEYIEEVGLKICNFKPIKILSSHSTCVSQLSNTQYNNRYWTKEKSIGLLLKAINSNISKKYNLLYDEKENIDFIQSITVKNQKNIAFNYKNGKILGYQVSLVIKDDPLSQLAANLCMAVGLGEKNSLGCGFCWDKKEG